MRREISTITALTHIINHVYCKRQLEKVNYIKLETYIYLLASLNQTELSLHILYIKYLYLAYVKTIKYVYEHLCRGRIL